MPNPSSITRRLTPAEAELALRRLELAAFRATLTTRELALGELRGKLISFEGRYLRQVGILLKQLDEWERKTAALHSAGAEDEMAGVSGVEAESETIAPRKMGFDVRALFRQLARRIHPDFAASAADELHRTRLMAQANDAFVRGDAGTLQRMLDGFDPDDALVTVEAELRRTGELIEQVRHDVASLDAEIDALHHSPSASLQRRTIEAALEGRDLLAEMATRVKGRIGLAMRQYELDQDRIKRPARGLRTEDLLSAEVRPSVPPRFDSKRRTWMK